MLMFSLAFFAVRFYTCKVNTMIMTFHFYAQRHQDLLHI